MHKKIVIFLPGKNTLNQSGLAKGSDWCLAGEKKSPVRGPFGKFPKISVFWRTDNFIVPPKMGGIFGIGK
jgi:hypothetical protein